MDELVAVLIGFIGVIVGATITPMAQYLWDRRFDPKISIEINPIERGRSDHTLIYHSIRIKNVGARVATKCSLWISAVDCDGNRISNNRLTLSHTDKLDDVIIYPDTFADVLIIEADLSSKGPGKQIQFHGSYSTNSSLPIKDVHFPLSVHIKFYCMEIKAIEKVVTMSSSDAEMH